LLVTAFVPHEPTDHLFLYRCPVPGSAEAPPLPGEPLDESGEGAGGPCGSDAVVCFRDPKGNEDPDNDDDDGDEAPGAPRPLYGFRGFSVRRLADGEIIERIPSDAPATGDSSMFATDRRVVVATADRLLLIPRAGVPGEPLELRGERSHLHAAVGTAMPEPGTFGVLRPLSHESRCGAPLESGEGAA